MLVIDFLPLLLQPRRHSTDAIKRCARVLLIEHAHQQQIGFAFWLWLIVEATARQAEQLALAAHAELRMITFDQLPLIIN